MSDTLLVVERVVLESLDKKELTLEALRQQTGFSQSLLNGVLHLLISKGIVTRNKNEYMVNWQRKMDWINLVKDEEGIRAELRELFSVMVAASDKPESTFRFKKVWLEPDEKREVERKWQEIESYLANIREKRKRKPVREKTIDKQVLLFGVSPYSSLVDGILKSA